MQACQITRLLAGSLFQEAEGRAWGFPILASTEIARMIDKEVCFQWQPKLWTRGVALAQMQDCEVQ